VNQITGLEQSSIHFFDTWGMDTENYEGNTILKLINGEVNTGFEMCSRIIINGKEEIKRADFQKHTRRIHSIVFFVVPDILDSPILIKKFVIVTKSVSNMLLCILLLL
jgi:hypothetical protein